MQSPFDKDGGQPAAGGPHARSPFEEDAGECHSPSAPVSSMLGGKSQLSPVKPSGYPEEQSKSARNARSAAASGKHSQIESPAREGFLAARPSDSAEGVAAINSSEKADVNSQSAAKDTNVTLWNIGASPDPNVGLTDDNEAPGEQQRGNHLPASHQSVRFRLIDNLSRGGTGSSRPPFRKRNNGDQSQLASEGPSSMRKTWTKLKAAGSATPGANAATAAGKRAARLGREAAKRSVMKATKAVKALKAVQGEIDRASRLQRMLGIQKYTKDDRLHQLAETETLLPPGECLQYDLKVLQYYTNTEKDIELRNRRGYRLPHTRAQAFLLNPCCAVYLHVLQTQATAFIYTPAAQIFMAVIIIFNTVFLGISTMEISSQAETGGLTEQPRNTDLIKWNKAMFFFLTVCNALFAIIFFVEMVLRIECDRGAYFKDFVNWTDFVNAWLGLLDLFIAALHYMEQVQVDVFQSIAAILRLVRLLRVLRFIRILKAFLPMRVLVDGMTASFFSLVYAVFFFVVLVYGVAVFFTTAFGTTQALHEYWGDLFTSMYTLFLILTMTNWDVVAAKTAVHYGWAKPVIVLYTVFSFFVLFNVVTAVIVEAFSSAAKRLQADAMHFAMFEECQDDEKVFSRALTKSHLLSAVSGVSFNGPHTDKPSFNAPFAYTYGGGDNRDRSNMAKSTKSTQSIPASNVHDVGVKESDLKAGDCFDDCNGEKQLRTKEAFGRVGESAGAAPAHSSFRSEVLSRVISSNCESVPTDGKLMPRKKFPSSLFASFVQPSSSATHVHGLCLSHTTAPKKHLGCVKGMLTTRSGNVCGQASDTGIRITPLPATVQAQEVHYLRTLSGGEQHPHTGPEEDIARDSPSLSTANTSAINQMLPTQGAERALMQHPGRTPGKALERASSANKSLESADVSGADDQEVFIGTTKKKQEAGLSNGCIITGEDSDNFGDTCGRVYDEGRLTSTLQKRISGGPQAVFSIDLRRSSPLQVLGTRAVQLAMRKCGISYIQAYDCLNILIQKGFEEVTGMPFHTKHG